MLHKKHVYKYVFLQIYIKITDLQKHTKLSTTPKTIPEVKDYWKECATHKST